MRGMCPSHVLFFRYLRHTHQTAIITHWTKEGAQLSLPLWLCIAQTQHAKLNQECVLLLHVITTCVKDRIPRLLLMLLCVVFQNQKLLGAAHVSFFYLEMRDEMRRKKKQRKCPSNTCCAPSVCARNPFNLLHTEAERGGLRHHGC